MITCGYFDGISFSAGGAVFFLCAFLFFLHLVESSKRIVWKIIFVEFLLLNGEDCWDRWRKEV